MGVFGDVGRVGKLQLTTLISFQPPPTAITVTHKSMFANELQ